MKKTLTRDTLEEILSDARLDAEDVVYNWPSGMYGSYGGHVSFALTADPKQLAQFFIAVGELLGYTNHVYDAPPIPEGPVNLKQLLPSGVDPLGLGTVTYFRGWELEPKEDGE